MVRHMALWSASAVALSLIVGVSLDAVGATQAPAVNKPVTEKQSRAIERQEQGALKRADEKYRDWAKAQAKNYKRLAKQLKKSGGDAQPLLNAAAYYDAEAAK